MHARTHYALLGIAHDADEATIRRAYRRVIRRVHPDRQPESSSWATQQAQAINEARDVLLDPVRRAAYDHSLRPPPPAANAISVPPSSQPSYPRPASPFEPDSEPAFERTQAPRPSSPDDIAPESLSMLPWVVGVAAGGLAAWAWALAAQQVRTTTGLETALPWWALLGIVLGGCWLGGWEARAAQRRWWWGPPRYTLFRLPVTWSLWTLPWLAWGWHASALGAAPMEALRLFKLSLPTLIHWNLAGVGGVMVWSFATSLLFLVIEPIAQASWRQRCVPGTITSSEGVARAVQGSSLAISAIVVGLTISWWWPSVVARLSFLSFGVG